jgi:hypothetical protein
VDNFVHKPTTNCPGRLIVRAAPDPLILPDWVNSFVFNGLAISFRKEAIPGRKTFPSIKEVYFVNKLLLALPKGPLSQLSVKQRRSQPPIQRKHALTGIGGRRQQH